jgi:hypothetical protein
LDELCRQPYPSDVGTKQWSLVAPYLLMQREDASWHWRLVISIDHLREALDRTAEGANIS